MRGAPSRRREDRRDMWKRLSISLIALAVLTAGCQEKPAAPGSFAQGSVYIKVLDAHFISMGDAAGGQIGGAGTSYAVIKMLLTNGFSDLLTPSAKSFVLTTSDGSRYFGVDSGSASLVGISNNYSPMKRDDSREFTIGFRIPVTSTGTLGYEI